MILPGTGMHGHARPPDGLQAAGGSLHPSMTMRSMVEGAPRSRTVADPHHHAASRRGPPPRPGEDWRL